MRTAIRRVAFVGDMELAVTVARDLMRFRPAVVHTRAAHLKVAVVARLLNVPVVMQAGRDDIDAITARAARAAERTVSPTASIREAIIEQGAPASSTVV